MHILPPDNRGFHGSIITSLIFHALVLLVVWKLPPTDHERASVPPIPIYIVEEPPPELPEPRPKEETERKTQTVPTVSTPAPPAPEPEPPRVSRPRPEPLPEDLPVSDELTDQPPSGSTRLEPGDTAAQSGDQMGNETSGDTLEGEAVTPGKGSKQPQIALYDPAVVGRIVGPKIPYGDVPEVTLDTAEFKHLSYMYKLKDQIERIWRYPSSAARAGITGDLYIRFVILADGSLGDVRLLRTSGYPELDEAALAAVREAAPFLPLPRKWGVEQFAIRGHFYYSLAGYYIR